jgi:predicted nuclease of predicted toxin-antitoxin system
MRFIVDAQLPPALARWLATQGHDAAHVSDFQMNAAADAEIWTLAEPRSAVLLIQG